MMMITMFINMLTIDKVQRSNNIQNQKIIKLERRMSTYEKRTTDALNNWDSMRKTQLTLMDLYFEEGK